eukprot:6201583-Karenia_brevis.AAC.1
MSWLVRFRLPLLSCRSISLMGIGGISLCLMLFVFGFLLFSKALLWLCLGALLVRLGRLPVVNPLDPELRVLVLFVVRIRFGGI